MPAVPPPGLPSAASGSNGFRDSPNRPDSNIPSPFPAAPRKSLWPPSTVPSSPAHSRPETHRPTPRSSLPIPPTSADTPLSLVGSQGFLLPAFDDRGILVHGGDSLLGTAPPQLPHQFAIDQP